MKTTVAQLIAKLQEFPMDAEVECMVEYSRGYETSTTFAAVDLQEMTYFDYTEDDKYPLMKGVKIVQIRGE